MVRPAFLLLPALASCFTTTVFALDNGFKTPAMGWSALYGAPFGSVNETMVVRAAEGLKASGLLAAGYNRVNLDDWYAIRPDGNGGKMQGSPKNFPSGMRACSDKVHAAGCLFGVYSAAGMRTCANYSASLFNEVNDANTFAHDWQVDMLKYDACKYNHGVNSRARYQAMGRALNATGRPILYSVEGWSPKDSDASWGPEIADSWRTGADIWPNWDNHPVCIMNNLYQTNAAAKWHKVGEGFNDPDMLQPPNTLKTVLKPGLAPEEAYSQFKLWVLMKAPLVLGTNWEQLADLETLEPTYFGMLTNKEILAINHDMSPQATLVRQFPSTAQQSGHGAALTNSTVPVTLQQCDLGRASQRWVSGSLKGSVQLEGTTLCLSSVAAGDGGVVLLPCSATSTVWGMLPDEQLHVGQAGTTGNCLTSNPVARGVHGGSPIVAPSIQECIYTGPVPPLSVMSTNFGTQAFVWGPTSSQVVAAETSMCLTAGLPNYDPEAGGSWSSNNGTLEHEVWMGDLTPLNGAPRRVVALFNKGGSTDALSAPASLYARDIAGESAKTVTVRDVVGKEDVPVGMGGAIEANVPRHGVALFVVTFGAVAESTTKCV